MMEVAKLLRSDPNMFTVQFSLMDYPGKAQASAAAVAKKLLGLAALFLVFQKVQRRLRCEFFLRL